MNTLTKPIIFEFYKPHKTLLLCIIFVTGLASSFLGLIPIFITVLFLSFITGIYTKTISPRFVFLCFSVALFSLFYFDLRYPKPDELQSIAPNKTCVTGRVISEPNRQSEDRFKAEIEVFSYKNQNGQTVKAKPSVKTLVNAYGKSEKRDKIHTGDIISFCGYIKKPYFARNPAEFDYSEYLKTRRIFTFINAKAESLELFEKPKTGRWFFLRKLNSLRNEIVEKNRMFIQSPQLEILEGMVFGSYAIPVSDEIKQDFTKSGLLHLLAASGMNVGFIFGFWYAIASVLRIPYKANLLGGAVLVLLYALMTGLPPSVTRAALMIEFIILGKIFSRQANPIILLALVCSLMLIYEPLLLASVSFQLSFLTTFGLLLFIPMLMEKLNLEKTPENTFEKKENIFSKLKEFIAGTVLIPLVAQIFASPVQLWHFNSFSTYSLLANILAVPFVGIISCLGFLGNILLFIPLIGEKILFLTSKIAKPLIDIILFISKTFSELPNALNYPPKPDLLTVFIFYMLLLFLAFCIKINFSSKKLNISAIFLAACMLVLYFGGNCLDSSKLRMVFFDVGQGDAILILLPGNKTVLVDTGPAQRHLAVKNIIIPYLRSKGINRIDALVLTHMDSDHAGGAAELIKIFPVGILYHNDIFEDTKTSRKIQGLIRENKVLASILDDNDLINLSPEVAIKAIRENNPNKTADNEQSIILYLIYKDFSALLTGDSESDAIESIKKYVKTPINILKVGHHASYNAVNRNYLEYLQPQAAVISVGEKGYRYGHPNRQVLSLLKEYGVTNFRTDRDFAVQINYDGRKLEYRVKKNKPILK